MVILLNRLIISPPFGLRDVAYDLFTPEPVVLDLKYCFGIKERWSRWMDVESQLV